MKLREPRCPVTSPPPVPFASEPGSAGAVRRYVRDRARAGGRPDLADDAEAVAAELFANAVEAQLRQGVTTVIPVQAIAEGRAVHIEIYDHARGVPCLIDLGGDWSTAERGRGLWLVHAISRGHWGWQAAGTGKVVAATITEPLPQDPRFAPAAF